MFTDAIHVGKSLKCSFANILLDNQCANFAIIRTLREASPNPVRQAFRKVLKNQDAV